MRFEGQSTWIKFDIEFDVVLSWALCSVKLLAAPS